MSFDVVALWPEPGHDPVPLALAECDAAGNVASEGLSDLRPVFDRIRSALPGGPEAWEAERASDDEWEFTHLRSAVQMLCTRHRIELSVAYGRRRSAFDTFIAALVALHDMGAIFVSAQSATTFDPTTDAERLWNEYSRAPRPKASRDAAPRLRRVPYTLGVIGLGFAVFASVAIAERAGLEQRHPVFLLAPFVVGLLVKMFILDVRRLRDTGGDERMVLWNILFPIGQLVLLPLFFRPSQSERS